MNCRECLHKTWNALNLGDLHKERDSKARIILSCLPVTGPIMFFQNTFGRLLGDLYPEADDYSKGLPGRDEFLPKFNTYSKYSIFSSFSTAALLITAIAKGALGLTAISGMATLLVTATGVLSLYMCYDSSKEITARNEQFARNMMNNLS